MKQNMWKKHVWLCMQAAVKHAESNYSSMVALCHDLMLSLQPWLKKNVVFLPLYRGTAKLSWALHKGSISSKPCKGASGHL